MKGLTLNYKIITAGDNDASRSPLVTIIARASLFIDPLRERKTDLTENCKIIIDMKTGRTSETND